jgi:AraC-like DNA-binding protein
MMFKTKGADWQSRCFLFYFTFLRGFGRHYRESLPSSGLRDLVLSFWEFAVAETVPGPRNHYVFPDGCTLLSCCGKSMRLTPGVKVFGPTMRSRVVPVRPGEVWWGVRLSYLKIFLIRASRLKLAQDEQATNACAPRMPPILERLKKLVEEHYRSKHRPADYARMVGMNPQALGTLTRTYFHKTLTDLIRERILKHAKWQLLHSVRPVKEIAYEVGFEDEFYFSRLFKRPTGCSPQFYREYETEIRGGKNLAPIYQAS